jgi:hypothetical protein
MTDLEEVLVLVNKARAALGQPPLETLPRGKKRDSSDCVIARSVGVNVGNRIAWIAAGRRRERRLVAGLLAEAWHSPQDVIGRRRVLLPGALRQFVVDFDAGAFPELVDRPHAVSSRS